MEKAMKKMLFEIKSEIKNLKDQRLCKYTEIEMIGKEINTLEAIQFQMEDALNRTQEVKSDE